MKTLQAKHKPQKTLQPPLQNGKKSIFQKPQITVIHQYKLLKPEAILQMKP